ncbi:MAG: multiheme c-type cytochrome [Halobacteriota archaeon]
MKHVYDWERKKAKKILPLVVVAVLSVSLGCTAVAVVAAEDVNCAMCHSEEAKNFETSLHHTNRGMILEWQRGAGDFCGLNATEYFEEKACLNCHIESCDKCHKDYGMYPKGHGETVGMETCDECHGAKRVASHFMGDWAGHKQEGPHADIHFEMGMNCMDCHTAEEMHGTGVEYSRMLQAVNVSCEDCHNSPGKEVKNMAVTQYSNDTPFAHGTWR